MFSIYFVFKVRKTIIFTKKQKILNILVLLLFPFFWSALIFYLLKKQPGSHEITVKNDVSTNSFYESGLGSQTLL